MNKSADKVVLDRFYESDVQTRGIVTVRGEQGDDLFNCKTLELPWKENKNNVSRIPAGEYRLKHRPAANSGKFGYDHFIVKGVPGRSYILFHKGAVYSHTLGCILVGHRFRDINGDGHPDVRESDLALRGLRETIVSESVPLIVRDRVEEMNGPVPVEEPEDISISGTEIPEHIPDRL